MLSWFGRGAPGMHRQLHRPDRRSPQRRRPRRTLYEAAALGLSLLRKVEWGEAIAPGTQLEVQVREPATTHTVSVAQIRRWCDGVAVSPDEVLKRRRVKDFLAG